MDALQHLFVLRRGQEGGLVVGDYEREVKVRGAVKQEAVHCGPEN